MGKRASKRALAGERDGEGAGVEEPGGTHAPEQGRAPRVFFAALFLRAARLLLPRPAPPRGLHGELQEGRLALQHPVQRRPADLVERRAGSDGVVAGDGSEGAAPRRQPQAEDGAAAEEPPGPLGPAHGDDHLVARRL